MIALSLSLVAEERRLSLAGAHQVNLTFRETAQGISLILFRSLKHSTHGLR